jgi:hypothetical protein
MVGFAADHRTCADTHAVGRDSGIVFASFDRRPGNSARFFIPSFYQGELLWASTLGASVSEIWT